MIDYRKLQVVESSAGRRYVTPAGKLPSITTVLGQTMSADKVASLQAWRDRIGHEEANQIGRAAADRGTAMHLLAERYLRGEDLKLAEFEKAHVDMFASIRGKLKNVTEVWGLEVPLYSNLLKVTGRTDFVGRYNGVPAILDYKTSTRYKRAEDLGDYRLQATFYAIAHNEIYGGDIDHAVILMATEGGLPLVFSVTPSDHVDELLERITTFYTNHP